MLTGSQILVKRIAARIRMWEGNSPEMRTLAAQIGTSLKSQIMVNIRRQRLIDTSNLWGSIGYEIDTKGRGKGFSVRAGSYGVPYAAFHEYGFVGTEQVGPFQRLQTQAWGRPIKPRMVSVRPHSRQVSYRGRPYIRPAFISQGPKIIQLLARHLAGKGIG